MTQDTDTQSDYIVIGAGIVGVSTAIWLQRAGHKVTLLDREGPAAGTSFGNAGVIASGSVVPIPVPGLMRKVPKMLLSPEQPLFLRWMQVPRLLPFLMRYMQNASEKSVNKISRGLFQLLNDALKQHQELSAGTPASKFVTAEPFIYAYQTQDEFDGDAYSWSVRKQRGVRFDILSHEELKAFDALLAEKFTIGVKILDNGKVADPGAYVQALAEHFVSEGGQLLQAELSSFELDDRKCIGLSTNKGQLKAKSYILTAGVQSGSLSQSLGINMPLESERGYHVEFTEPSMSLRSPVMISAEKFVATTMNGRLRCAGVVEFGNVSAPASKAPFELIKRKVKKVFPNLQYKSVKEWMGHRPATPDSLPLIGYAPKASNVLVGYGHQHIGLSSGPKTGRWLAGLATGSSISEDLSPYAPDRGSVAGN